MRCGMMTPFPTNGKATENMAIAAGKGPKTQKIGLKEQALALVQLISDSASLQIVVGITHRDARRAGETVPQASRVFLPLVPVPTPWGEERAADAPGSLVDRRNRQRLPALRHLS